MIEFSGKNIDMPCPSRLAQIGRGAKFMHERVSHSRSDNIPRYRPGRSAKNDKSTFQELDNQ